MTGVDYEPLDNWRLDGFDGLRRKSPVRLRDREAFATLLKKFAEYQGDHEWELMIDEVDYPASTSVDDLFDMLPRSVSVVHMQSTDADYIVRLTSWGGGETWIVAPQKIDDEYLSPLRSLISIVELNSRPLGWRRHIGRLPWPRRANRYRVSVIERVRRDTLEQRRYDSRSAVIGGLFGLLGGVVAALATLAASGGK